MTLIIMVGGLVAVSVVWWTDRERAADGPPIKVDLQKSWGRIHADRSALGRATERARRMGNKAQAAQLAFYAESAAAFGDIRLVITTARFGASLVVRVQPTGGESLGELARRQSAEVAAQGRRMVVRRAMLDGAAAWRFDFDTGTRVFQQVKFWLDHAGQRYSVELSGAPVDVKALAAAVRVA